MLKRKKEVRRANERSLKKKSIRNEKIQGRAINRKIGTYYLT